MPLPDRVRLILLFGGRSAEHDVSRVSARHVLAAVDQGRYEVVPIGITRDGHWHHAESAAALAAGGRLDELPDALQIDRSPTSAPEVVAAAERDGIVTVVLPVLHGPFGEDGCVQGLLEMAGLPYVGAGVLGSAVSMDKAAAKTLTAAAGIAQPRWTAVGRSDRSEPGLGQRLVDGLGPTVFVKPANMGSSIGVTRATGADETDAALELAFRYDDVAVVEEALEDIRELECAVLGNEEPLTSVVGEIRPGAEFYDFADKYSDGVAQVLIPAQIDDDTMARAQELALRAYRALRAEGMARVDMFLTTDGQLLLNEINTLPGFTPISMYPRLWEHSGLSYGELIDRLVELALQRHERRGAHATVVIDSPDHGNSAGGGDGDR